MPNDNTDNTGPVIFLYEGDYDRLSARETAEVFDEDGAQLTADWDHYAVTLYERPIHESADPEFPYVDDVWCVRVNGQGLPICDVQEDDFAGYRDFESRQAGVDWIVSKGLIMP